LTAAVESTRGDVVRQMIAVSAAAASIIDAWPSA
jgi:hypothetical protein